MFWTTARVFGILLIFFAALGVVWGFLFEYKSPGQEALGGFRYKDKPAVLTRDGRGAVMASAVGGGFGVLLMLIGGPSRVRRRQP